MIDRRAQAAVVVILERDEAERLQYSVHRLPHGAQDLSHAMDWPRLRLKCQFDERTGSKGMLQLQQSTGHGDALEFSSCTPAIF
jgi:hypothetical protein